MKSQCCNARFQRCLLRLNRAFVKQAETTASLQQALDQERKISEQLAQAQQARDDFMSNVTHELRTPLGAIKGFAQIRLERLERNLHDPEYTRQIEASGMTRSAFLERFTLLAHNKSLAHARAIFTSG